MAYAPKQTLNEGFEKFVIKNPDGCWDWKGCCPANPGYGQFRHGMRLERSHRASWIIHFGPIPKGMFVCHKCDNKRCSNPEHLFLATCKENNLDAIQKGIHSTMGKKGSENHRAKLTESKVEEIRNILKNKKNTQNKIAKQFGVTQTTISAINLNRLWR